MSSGSGPRLILLVSQNTDEDEPMRLARSKILTFFPCHSLKRQLAISSKADHWPDFIKQLSVQNGSNCSYRRCIRGFQHFNGILENGWTAPQIGQNNISCSEGSTGHK